MYTKLSILIFALFSSWSVASAEVIITEIMYDAEGTDANREWIEIYNNGDSPVVIKGGASGDDSWRIFQKSASGVENNRTVDAAAYQGDMTIDGGEYAVVVQDGAQFKTDFSSYTGTILISSAMSLVNTEATLGLRLGSGGTPWSLVQYNSELGANGDGKSLQLISGIWTPGIPTPGEGQEGSQTTFAESSSVSSSQKPQVVVKKEITTKITSPRLVFAGVPANFEATTYGLDGEILPHGMYFWNFGDGDSRKSNLRYSPEKFTHIFEYPGDYTVSLEYYKGYFGEIPDAVSEVIIKVIPTEISISAVGDSTKFFIEILNNTSYEADISHWYLSSGSKSFVFPKNMIMDPGRKLRISSKLTGFEYSDRENIKLLDSQGNLVFEYSKPLSPKDVAVKPKTVSVKTAETAPLSLIEEEIVPEESLMASVPVQEEKRLPVMAFSVLLVGSGALVYYVRRKGDILEE